MNAPEPQPPSPAAVVQPPKPIDWERIGAEYRAGQLSVREIARRHPAPVSEGAIRKKAKAENWERALADKVRTAVCAEGTQPGTQAQRASDLSTGAVTDHSAPAQATTTPAEKSEPKGDQITYLPGEGDPASTKWGGQTFHANMPQLVRNPEIVARARANRFFKVGDFKPGDAVETRDEPAAPKTPEQYRAHAIAWLKTMQSVDELDQKWIAEETLRMSCGVGEDDLELLMDLFGPKRAELRKRDQA